MRQRSERPSSVRSSSRRQQILWIGGGLILAAGIGIAALAGRPVQPFAPSADAIGAAGAPTWPVVEVYKSPACGCCTKWVEHLQAQGFTVKTTEREDLTTLKASHGVPPQLQTCHTALVGGYVVEGHVPAADLRRLLTDRPDVVGLAVAGMPTGSPGMEEPGRATQPYEVVAFGKNGATYVFATYGG
jgi:hypothetical protein